MKFHMSSVDAKALPKGVINWRLAMGALTASMAGSLFGFDTGNIGGIIVLPSFKKTFGLLADGPNAYQSPTLSANIVTTLQIGAVLGSLFAFTVADRFGRRKSLIGFSALFLLGVALQCVAHLNTLYAGRVVAGIATGGTTVIAPMYISEISPKAIRGTLTGGFNLIMLMCLSLAFWINYAVSKWANPTDSQWRTPMATQMIPGGLLFIGMFFALESPRYLIVHDRYEEAVANLTKLRGLPSDHDFVRTELVEIVESVRTEKSAVAGTSTWTLVKEVAFVPTYRRRYILAMILQIFQQMTGTNAINYFSPSIFASVGISGTSGSLLYTGVYGLIKVISTLVYVLFIIDNVGRRRPLMIGATIQACCLLYLAIFVKVADPQADQPITPGGLVGVVSIYIYAVGWTMGWSIVPWVVPSEIFPNRIRAICMSSIFAFQWLLNFAITRATPTMMLNLNKWGAYMIFSMFTFAGIIWVFFFFPEFKGRSIESMDLLFANSTFKMRKLAYPTEAEKFLVDVPNKLQADKNKKENEVNLEHLEGDYK